MKRMTSSLLALLLALSMLIGMVPVAFAEEAADTIGTGNVSNEDPASGVQSTSDEKNEAVLYTADGEETSESAYVTVNDGETKYTTLAEAVSAAEPDADGVITYAITGKVEVTVQTTNPWAMVPIVSDAQAASVRKVRFVKANGASEAEICLADAQAIIGKENTRVDAEYDGLTLSRPNGAVSHDAGNTTKYYTTWLRGGGDLTYTNCTFPNGASNNQYGNTTFDNCQFTSTTGWSLWACNEGSVTTVKKCMFTGTRGIKLYAEGGYGKAGEIKLENVSFNLNDATKAAVEIAKPGKVSMENVSVTGTTAGTIKKNLDDNYKTVDGIKAVTVSATGTGISGTFEAQTTNDVANEEFNITAGTFTSEVSSDYCADGFEVKKSKDGTTWGVVESTATDVAKIGTTYYTDLQTAINEAAAVNNYKEVTLLKDVTINKTINFAKLKTNGSTELNLDGHTLTCEGDRAILIEAGTLYIKNGTVTSTGLREDQNSTSVIRIGSNNAEYANQTPKLVLSTNAKVVAPGCYGVTIFGSTTVSEGLQVNQSASIEATGPCPAISGQGGANFHKVGQGSKIVILGTVTATQNYAIFHPDNGELNIQQNAVISGKGGIQMCSGTLNIIDSPKITATGKAAFTTIDSGPVYDNTAAITAINRNYPGGAPVVKISGTPTITAEGNADHAIYAFTWTKEKDKPGETSDWTGAGENINISGGTYNKEFSTDYLANGYKLGEQDTDGNYTVEKKMVAQIGENQYPTLEAAINAAADGAEIKLIDDTTENGMDITKSITIDFQNHVLTVEDPLVGSTGTVTNGIRFLKNGDKTNTVVLKNGTIKSSKARTLINSYANLTVDNMKLDLSEQTLYSYVLSNNNGTTVIKDSVITAPEVTGSLAFDACAFASYGDVSVTLTGTSVINGNVAFSRSSDAGSQNASLTLESGTIYGSLVDLGKGETVKVTKKSGVTGLDTAPTGYKWVENTDGTQSLAKKAEVAQIGETKYETLAEAIKDLKENETLTLLADVENVKYAKADVIDIKLPAGATLDGNGNTISGNIKVNVNAAGGTIKNVTFKDIHDSTALSQAQITKYGFSEDKVGTLSSIYASNLTGKLTITDCTFENVDWEHMQITPKEGAEISITNNIFKISDSETVKEQLRHVHIEMAYSSGKYDCEGKKIKATVTDNQFLDATKEATLGVWWVGKDSTLDLTGNYYADTDAVSITLSDTSFNRENHCELIFPARSAADKDVDDLKAVASVDLDKFNSKFYTSLADAIAAAQPGETVKLLADCASDRINLEAKDLTVDLNGHTLTSTADYGVMFCAKNGHKITINGTTEGSTLNGTVMVTETTSGHIVLNGGTYTNGKYCPIYINGAVSTDDSTLTVTNAVINAVINATIAGTATQPETGDGAYLAGYSKANFTNTTINAEVTGLEIRAGELTMTNCTVTGGNGNVTETAHGSGATVRNAAIAVSQHTTKKPIKVTITGGTYTGSAAFYQSDVQNTGSKDVNTYIKSGEFNGTVEAKTSGALAISGGTFNQPVLPEYCADGYGPKDLGNDKYGVEVLPDVAQIGDVTYKSLQAAIDAAKSGATVQLIADTRENVTISKKLTLDLNGFTLNGGTVAGKAALKIDNKAVKVVDNSEAKTGKIMREDTAANSGVSSYYVIDIQGKNGSLKFYDATVVNNSGTTEGERKGASLVRIGDDSVENYPVMTVYSGTFTQNNFVAIKVDRGTLYVKGGTINCENDEAIKNWRQTYIQGGTVNGTVASWVYADSKSDSLLRITGGTVKGNVYAMTYDGTEGKTAKVYIEKYSANGSGQTVETVPTINGALGTYQGKNIKEMTEIMEAAKASITVSDGVFDREVPERFCADGYHPVENGDGTFGVAKIPVAQIGETTYGSLRDAISACSGGEIITLLRDVTDSNPLYSKANSFTLDLNGHTYNFTGNAGYAAFSTDYSNVTITVKNGTINSTGALAYIPEPGLTESSAYNNSGYIFENVTATANGSVGIKTNGQAENNTITLKDSTLNVPNGYGIFFPSSGTLTIDNSKINALTMGVQVCAGSLSINEGSAITVKGDGKQKTENDGAIEDGAAISIVNRDGYKGLGDITITGGTFKSNGNNAAVKAYDWNNTDKTEADFTANKNVSISGGWFSTKVPEGLCADGYEPTGKFTTVDGLYTVDKTNKEASYIDTNGILHYGELKELLNVTESAGRKMTIYKEVTVDTIVIDDDRELNLNGNTLIVNKRLIGIWGTIIDDSNGKGLIKGAAGSVRLAPSNSEYLPIYVSNDAGYRLYKCTTFSKKYTSVEDKTLTEEQVKIKFAPVFKALDAYNLLKTDTHNVSVKVDVSWKTADGKDGGQTFTFTQEMLKNMVSTLDMYGRPVNAVAIILSGLDSDVLGSISNVTAQYRICSDSTGTAVYGQLIKIN